MQKQNYFSFILFFLSLDLESVTIVDCSYVFGSNKDR